MAWHDLAIVVCLAAGGLHRTRRRGGTAATFAWTKHCGGRQFSPGPDRRLHPSRQRLSVDDSAAIGQTGTTHTRDVD